MINLSYYPWLKSKKKSYKYVPMQINTVDVRNPDVRISAFSIVVRFPNSPDFERSSENRTLYPVFGRPVQSTSGLRFSDVRFIYKPVPNRFGTGFECLKTGRYIRFSDVIYIYI